METNYFSFTALALKDTINYFIACGAEPVSVSQEPAPHLKRFCSLEKRSTGYHLASLLTLPSDVRCPCLGGGTLGTLLKGSSEVWTSSDDGRSPEGSTLRGGGHV